tara:strand:+ start:1296 stop:1805 length:510 start_codon:yes stop_codon:yes gene_type:complete
METSKTLTGQQLNDLTLFAVATLVSHSHKQENDKEQTTHDTSGPGSKMPLAHYDQSTQSWRMSEDMSLWGDYKSLGNLPKSGMTRNGRLFQLPRRVRRTLGNAFSFWPTLSANGMGNTGSQQMLQTLVNSGELTIDEKKGMSAGNGGRINPTWAEWFMGFPTGWTNLED